MPSLSSNAFKGVTTKTYLLIEKMKSVELKQGESPNSKRRTDNNIRRDSLILLATEGRK